MRGYEVELQLDETILSARVYAPLDYSPIHDVTHRIILEKQGIGAKNAQQPLEAAAAHDFGAVHLLYLALGSR